MAQWSGKSTTLRGAHFTSEPWCAARKFSKKKGASIHCAKFPPLLLFDTRNGRGSRVQFLLVSPVYHRSKYRNIILLVGALSQTASDWDFFTNVFLACLWCYRHFWFQYIHELICVDRFFTSWFVTFPSPLSSLHTRQIRSHCGRYCLGISLCFVSRLLQTFLTTVSPSSLQS